MPQGAQGRGSRRTSPLLWVLLAVLVMLAAGAVTEMRARRQAQQAFETLQGLIDSTPGLEPEAVQQHLGVQPVEAYRTEDKRWIEVYRWDGLLQPYWVYATYRIGATRLLLSVTHNRPPVEP